MRQRTTGQVMRHADAERVQPTPAAVVERPGFSTDAAVFLLRLHHAVERPLGMLITGIGGLGAASGIGRVLATFQFQLLHF